MKEPLAVITPGGTIGILGGGQLGRMLAIEARRMGYKIKTLSPERNSPTAQIADKAYVSNYHDADALTTFAKSVDVITFEFENVPSRTLDIVSQYTPVRPFENALRIAQNRLAEKQFFQSIGLPTVPYVHVNTAIELISALDTIGFGSILKTVRSGYDGKGQLKIKDQEALAEAYELVKTNECVLEGFANFALEISVIACRGMDGQIVDYGTVENIHKNHILDGTIAPARVSPEITQQATRLTRILLEKLEYVGVLCVELFVMPDGTLLVNEFAPRPHNSGHYTVEACATNQFEQQLRAVCGLPLGSTAQLKPAAMVNLLGEMWGATEPNWDAALKIPGVKIHLYGKQRKLKGRKMGHISALASSTEEAMENACAARTALFE